MIVNLRYYIQNDIYIHHYAIHLCSNLYAVCYTFTVVSSPTYVLVFQGAAVDIREGGGVVCVCVWMGVCACVCMCVLCVCVWGGGGGACIGPKQWHLCEQKS